MAVVIFTPCSEARRDRSRTAWRCSWGPEVGVLAHGGAVGAVAEGAFILIPIVVFAVLARVSRKRREAEEAADGEPESTPS